MNIRIRQETEKDYAFTEAVVEKAFKSEEHSDHKEHFLVAKLRKSDVFVPELSLVAEMNKEIIVDVPDESFMALELEKGSLDHVEGTVVYSKEFFE